jgi:myo-inositol-1(or 4)-monophosphatase
LHSEASGLRFQKKLFHALPVLSLSSSPPDTDPLLTLVHSAAIEAGRMAMRYFRKDRPTTARIWNKAGGSPVTEADVAVDAFLKTTLSLLMPEAAWLSEETADNPARLGSKKVWIVDPIDGTRAFLSGHEDWSVVIALLEDNEPVLGIVHAPALEISYTARRGTGAWRNGEQLLQEDVQREEGRGDKVPLRLAGPTLLLDRLGEAFMPYEKQPRIPSLALRIVRVAEGQIDAGLITPDARDWDLAAADLVLREAGGALSDMEGKKLLYNRELPVHGALIAARGPLHDRLIAAMKSGI